MNRQLIRLVVHEPAPRFGPLLARALSDDSQWDVRLCPHRTDLAERIRPAETAGCLIVLAPATNCERLFPLIAEIASITEVFLLAPPVEAGIEWFWREAGVRSFLELPISVGQLVRILRRRLQSGLD